MKLYFLFVGCYFLLSAPIASSCCQLLLPGTIACQLLLPGTIASPAAICHYLCQVLTMFICRYPPPAGTTVLVSVPLPLPLVSECPLVRALDQMLIVDR